MADVKKINGYNIKDETARDELNNKTNTSVIPNNGGEIKTKYRISQKGYTNGATWYYPIAKLPADNSGNYASAIINGRIGGWVSNNMSSVYSLIWNRDGTGIALLDIAGTAGSMSSIWNTCDIVVYTNSDTTDTIYLKCNSYFTFDIDLELFQSTAEILYDGSYLTSTPSGTLTAQASTSTKRLELVNGKLKINGADAATANDLSGKANDSAVVHKSGDETIAGIKTFNDNTFFNGTATWANCDPAFVSQFMYGMYQWDNMFQFTKRNTSNGFINEAWHIALDAEQTVFNYATSFASRPTVGGVQVALLSDIPTTYTGW